MRDAGRPRRWVLLDPKQKLGTDKNPLDPALDSPLEPAFGVSAGKERHQGLQISRGDRSSVGSPRHRGQDLPRTSRFAHSGRRPANEDATARWGVAGTTG